MEKAAPVAMPAVVVMESVMPDHRIDAGTHLFMFVIFRLSFIVPSDSLAGTTVDHSWVARLERKFAAMVAEYPEYSKSRGKKRRLNEEGPWVVPDDY